MGSEISPLFINKQKTISYVKDKNTNNNGI